MLNKWSMMRNTWEWHFFRYNWSWFPSYQWRRGEFQRWAGIYWGSIALEVLFPVRLKQRVKMLEKIIGISMKDLRKVQQDINILRNKNKQNYQRTNKHGLRHNTKQMQMKGLKHGKT